MSRKRPGSLTAAAVLCIIYGGLFTLCGLCGVVGLVTQGGLGKNFLGGGNPGQAQLEKQLEEALEKDIPAYKAMQAINVVLGLGISLALLIAGIGLLNLQSWARIMGLLACSIAICSTAFQAVYQSVYVLPATNRVFQVVLPAGLPKQPGDQNILRTMQTIMTAITVAIIVLYIAIVIYLAIILFLLFRRNVKAALAGLLPEGTEGDRERRPSETYEEDQGWGQSPRSDDPNDDWRYR